jgi:tripartite-type tricarboxylate transporter receptor subunit TctC
VKIVNLPTVWYTPNSTPAAKNLEEYVAYLRSLKRPINAGIFNNQARSILQVLAKNYHLDINLIVFKNGPQMYPSLIDGSLDLALDSGGGIPTAEQGRFKLIGHVSSGPITRLRSYVNFASDSKELLAIESWMGIAVPKNLRAETKQQLTQQIVSIVRQDSFRAFVDDAIASVDGSSGQRLTMIIDNQKKLVEKYWQ